MNIVVAVTSDEEAPLLCRWGWRMARALEQGLVVLWLPRSGLDAGARVELPTASEAALPDSASAALRAVCAALAPRASVPPSTREAPSAQQASAVGAASAPVTLAAPPVRIEQLGGRDPLHEVLDAAAAAEASFLLVVPPTARPRLGSSLARRLFAASPYNTLMLRLGANDPGTCQRILVGAAGGPHALLGLRLASSLATADDGMVSALFVEPIAVEHGVEVGERLLTQALAHARVESDPRIEHKVVLSDDVQQAISDEAAKGYDLLLLGAPNPGALRALLFGSVPERLLAGREALTVAVLRARWSLVDRMRQRLGRWLALTVPQLSRDERIAVFERLQSGSGWNFDFMALIALSTAIATLGLLENSAAVVIGAMLVAPLMTPILGAGLALVQGNLPLLRSAWKSLLYGCLVALAISLLLGLAARPATLTAELLARGGPTLLDMAVAFAAGLAAAYCLGRPGLLEALPGVAIAAALVPPIATAGVSLAIGEITNAVGAALLFSTNVVVIVLAAAASLYGLGVRRKPEQTPTQRWTRIGLLSLLVGATLLAIPLGTGLLDRLQREQPELPAQLTEELEGLLQTLQARIAGLRMVGDGVVEVEVESPRPLPETTSERVAAAIRRALGDTVRVRITTDLVVESQRRRAP